MLRATIEGAVSRSVECEAVRCSWGGAELDEVGCASSPSVSDIRSLPSGASCAKRASSLVPPGYCVHAMTMPSLCRDAPELDATKGA